MQIGVFGTPELSTSPEIQDISRRHTIYPFLATDSMRSWNNELRRNSFDILHFGGHISLDQYKRPSRLHIGAEVLTVDDIMSMARLCSARLVFLNGCDSAYMANALVRNGLPAAIYTTIELEDADAWKFPLSFYEVVARQEDEHSIIDLRKAFEASVDRNGVYGWVSNGHYETDLLKPIVSEIGRIYHQMAEHETDAQGALWQMRADLESFEKLVKMVAIAGAGGIATNIALSALSLMR